MPTSITAHANNLRDVKKNLAAAFPDVEFTWDTAGRGHDRGHACRWTGGPLAAIVRAAAMLGWRMTYHFQRKMTEAEAEVYYAEQQAKWAAEEAARAAAEPARKAAAKAAGIAKRAETAKVKRDALATLTEAFPGVPFKVSAGTYSLNVCWTDGPEREAVESLPNLKGLCFEHTRTPAGIVAKLEAAFGATYPGVVYKVFVHGYYDRVEIIWTDGPQKAEVEGLISRSSAARKASPEGIAATRIRRRLAASQSRAAAKAKGIERRASEAFPPNQYNAVKRCDPNVGVIPDPRQVSMFAMFEGAPAPVQPDPVALAALPVAEVAFVNVRPARNYGTMRGRLVAAAGDDGFAADSFLVEMDDPEMFGCHGRVYRCTPDQLAAAPDLAQMERLEDPAYAAACAALPRFGMEARL